MSAPRKIVSLQKNSAHYSEIRNCFNLLSSIEMLTEDNVVAIKKNEKHADSLWTGLQYLQIHAKHLLTPENIKTIIDAGEYADKAAEALLDLGNKKITLTEKDRTTLISAGEKIPTILKSIEYLQKHGKHLLKGEIIEAIAHSKQDAEELTKALVVLDRNGIVLSKDLLEGLSTVKDIPLFVTQLITIKKMDGNVKDKEKIATLLDQLAEIGKLTEEDMTPTILAAVKSKLLTSFSVFPEKKASNDPTMNEPSHSPKSQADKPPTSQNTSRGGASR